MIMTENIKRIEKLEKRVYTKDMQEWLQCMVKSGAVEQMNEQIKGWSSEQNDLVLSMRIFREVLQELIERLGSQFNVKEDGVFYYLDLLKKLGRGDKK